MVAERYAARGKWPKQVFLLRQLAQAEADAGTAGMDVD